MHYDAHQPVLNDLEALFVSDLFRASLVRQPLFCLALARDHDGEGGKVSEAVEHEVGTDRLHAKVGHEYEADEDVAGLCNR
jgi:hypothetical protein